MKQSKSNRILVLPPAKKEDDDRSNVRHDLIEKKIHRLDLDGLAHKTMLQSEE